MRINNKRLIVLALASIALIAAARKIVNSEIASNAAINFSKMESLTASRVACTDGSGVVSACTMPSSYLDATSSIQTQINGKQASDADLSAIAGVTSAADKVAYFTGSATATVADFTSSGREMVAAASAAAQTALLSAFAGDSGSGAVKGLVPAAASGDAAAGKFLKADGVWTAPASAKVTTSDSGTYGIEVARLGSSSGNITSQTGSWISSVSGTTIKTVTIAGGIFSATPTCFITGQSTANADVYCGINDTPSTTSVVIVCRDNAGTGVNPTITNIICMGPR